MNKIILFIYLININKIFIIINYIYKLNNFIYNIKKMNSGNISNEQKLKQTKSKVDFNNIKSIFIIKKIINKTKKYRFLKIIKYNKQIQKRLDININNYKEFYCSPIEIELTLVNNKYTSFINIPKKDKKYYHIYFDDPEVEANIFE